MTSTSKYTMTVSSRIGDVERLVFFNFSADTPAERIDMLLALANEALDGETMVSHRAKFIKTEPEGEALDDKK